MALKKNSRYCKILNDVLAELLENDKTEIQKADGYDDEVNETVDEDYVEESDYTRITDSEWR